MHFLSLVVAVLAIPACGPLACGSTTAGVTGAPTATSTSTARPTVTHVIGTTTQALSALQNVPAATDLSNLHIQTVLGPQCSSWLVLKGQPPHRVDAGALQQMQTYLHTVAGYYTNIPDSQAFINPTAFDQTPVPPTLDAVLGSVGDEYSRPAGGAQFGCENGLFITNTDPNTADPGISLTQVGVTYTAASMPNTFTYQLVDLCTVVHCGPCDGCGSQSGCYDFAPFTLRPGPIETHQEVAPQSNDPANCPASAPLMPGQVTSLFLDYGSSVSQQIYEIGLTLTFNTPAGQQSVTLPDEFNGALAFAQRSQFVCYALQGNTFVQEPAPFARSCI